MQDVLWRHFLPEQPLLGTSLRMRVVLDLIVIRETAVKLVCA